MPFAIILMPSAESPSIQQVDQSLHETISAGASPVVATGRLRSTDGIEFRIEDSTIWLDRLSPGMCKLIFDATFKTSAYLITSGSGGALEVAGSKGAAPPELSPTEKVVSSGE